MQLRQYRVRPGVTAVNGQKVPSNRLVMLSDVQARYDLDHGRIEPVKRPRSRKRKPTNGGN
ncbi:MAG: hypothetical protein ACK4GT_00105 [Pararhodobacter sp.]